MNYFQKSYTYLFLLAIALLPNMVNGQIQDDMGIIDTAISGKAIYYTSVYYSDDDGNGSTDCIIGLSQGNPVTWADFSCIVRFKSDVGFIDAHNGSTYTYISANGVPIGSTFDVKYEVWFEIDFAAGKWTPWVKGPGMPEPVKILDNVDFRNKSITEIDTWKAVHALTGDDGLDILTVGRVDTVGGIPASYNQASIASVSFFPEGLNETWHPDSLSYTATFPYGTSSVNVVALPLQHGTTISGDGSLDVTSASGQISLEATSESTTATQTYTIDWTKTDPMKDTTLSTLQILNVSNNAEYEGLSPEFSPTITDYLIDLPVGVQEVIVKASASAEVQGANVSGDGTIDVSSKAEVVLVTVTSADGLASQTYKIEIFVGRKSIYIPTSFGDPTNASSQYCYERSIESENWIVFWEAGYGTDPGDDPDPNMRVDVNYLLWVAEKSFVLYRDSLKFIEKGSSKTDDYKMIILLDYTIDWKAFGSGVDEVIGQLILSASAARAGMVTIAHEVGHCFQYQAGKDQYPLAPGAPKVGWDYGLGTNGEGGNGWWEQCAQWQAFKVDPGSQFNGVGAYLFANHLNILHEKPRYDNYFIQDYWTYKHGWDFIGRLWRESYFPEDPVDAYKRITGLTQEEFNDEMYEHAARLTTWDIPHIIENGKSHILDREMNPLIAAETEGWTIGADKCIENYGYNVVRLNTPDIPSKVSVYFEGKSGADGYRSINKTEAGWRYGFVALLENGKRIYSTMRSPKYDKVNDANPLDTLNFYVPDRCEKLWFVISGAPQKHWHHEWDDNAVNDEQWPYQVIFENTNPYGVFEFEQTETAYSDTLTHIVPLLPVTTDTYPKTSIKPDLEKVCKAFKLSFSEIKTLLGSQIKYCAVDPDGAFNYQSTANAPGHWFADNGYVTTYGNTSSHIFSEFGIDNFEFNLGQYPNRCKSGDEFTIKQALVYTPQGQASVYVMFEFNIKIVSQNNLDGDSYTDANDNCPSFYNEDQSDIDGDGIGDICDLCPTSEDHEDSDGDGVLNGCDMCDGFNDYSDADGDGVPDGCDVCQGFDDSIDDNEDGVPDGCQVSSIHSTLFTISLSPNPVEDILNINWSDAPSGVSSIKIYDINGRLQWESVNTIGKQAFVDVGFLKQGMYFLYINSETYTGNYKFIKR